MVTERLLICSSFFVCSFISSLSSDVDIDIDVLEAVDWFSPSEAAALPRPPAGTQ